MPRQFIICLIRNSENQVVCTTNEEWRQQVAVCAELVCKRKKRHARKEEPAGRLTFDYDFRDANKVHLAGFSSSASTSTNSTTKSGPLPRLAAAASAPPADRAAPGTREPGPPFQAGSGRVPDDGTVVFTLIK